MRKFPRWKKHCYIRNTTTGRVDRRIHGDADYLVKHGSWIFTTKEAWEEYVGDTPRPIPERKLQGVLVPAVKGGFQVINGLLSVVFVNPTQARNAFATAKKVITDWSAQRDAENEQYQKAVALYAEQEARRDNKCRVRLAEELAQISRAQEAARKIHSEHPPIPTEYLSPEAIAVFTKHGPPARNVRRNAGRKPKLCPVCGLPETREKPFEVAHKIPHTAGVRAGFTPEYLSRRENLVWAHRGKCNDMVEIPPEFWITEAKREAVLATIPVIALENKTAGGTNAETLVESEELYASKSGEGLAIGKSPPQQKQPTSEDQQRLFNKPDVSTSADPEQHNEGEGIRSDKDTQAAEKQHPYASMFGGLSPLLGAAGAETQIASGGIYASKGEYNRTIADYDEAISRDPENVDFFVARGRIYVCLGQNDRAIIDFGEAIRLQPKCASAFYNRGIIYAATKQHDRAIADYDEAIRHDPGSAESFCMRGHSFSAKGRCDRAIADYDEAIRLDPHNAVAFFGRGMADANKGQYERAIADFDEAIRLRPNFSLAIKYRAYAVARNGS